MVSVAEFGNKLKRIRMERGLSQRRLAEMMAVSNGAVANWENGTRLPDVSMLSRLAECLGVESYVLLDAMRRQSEPLCVIVVEDVPLLLRGVIRMVQDELPDADISGFENGADTLAFADAHRAQIAFLDIELDKHMNGVELAKRLKELNPRVNIVFLTSFGEYAQAAHELYSSGYIRKPITPEKIREALDNLRYPIRGVGI